MVQAGEWFSIKGHRRTLLPRTQSQASFANTINHSGAITTKDKVEITMAAVAAYSLVHIIEKMAHDGNRYATGQAHQG